PKGLPPVLSQLLAAQAQHETGNFSSNFFVKYKNAFGYSRDTRSQYQIGGGTIADNGTAIGAYVSVADSTREIVDWIYRRVKEGKFPANLDMIQTPEEYALLLKNAGYYTDTLTNYVRGLKLFFGSTAGAGTLLLVGLGFAAWYFTSTKSGREMIK
ncbi:MAG TPA: glucosaminidase domain-containing protein, partial [Mucilaginibacter sp.]|nr:glucosaminidase domain-containing protein [Mucilaginibacter sp.]